jgi:hypothetical protein
MKTTWRKELEYTLNNNNELWEDIIYTTLTNEDMDKEFDEGYGVVEGEAFTLWTKDFVYFPATYDGSEWVASIPRNPKKIKTIHVGSW